jgi:hypothetical protein
MQTHGFAALLALPTPVLVGLGLLLLVEIALDVIALVDLYRRPVDRVVFGNKWVWVAIIVLVNTIGAILYLAVGRKPVQRVEPLRPSESATTRTANAADILYGAPKDADRR